MTAYHTLRQMALGTLIAAVFCAKATGAQARELETLTVAGGCFWCVEADFEKVPGVIEAVSGFMGGDVPDPTYKQVTKGGTGHLEAVQITFDPAKVSRAHLIGLFFRSIDPTDAGGQFCDRGKTYTTAVFVDDEAERALAVAEKAKAGSALGQKVVTAIRPAGPFYPAGAYHQDYYKQNAIVLTRFGPRKKSSAYKLYREGCGRDDRVRALWGSEAPFVGG